ncbi:hypothetical protein JKA74_15960 [Marivirga sp. S37H4]|uniref:YbbR-like domain-containing protein n=1 Tax=Marivirga aurantiaca TaxID=2802615 RepID=A0A934X132_9BACT|nr:hypothetical protein [Marivirga aurantiaca]MBK6266541.1 hypothetical protein [Marivirga aurantiaca]
MKIIDKILDGLSNTFLPNSNETLKVVVLCIVTATTFWFFNALNDSYTTSINYPIKFTYPDSVYVAVEELPEEVQINVTGGGWNLLRKTLWFTNDPVEVQLSDPAGNSFILGSSLYPLISDQITELQLNFIETDRLPIEIDSIKTKKAKIEVDSLEIDLKENFRITSVINTSVDSAEFTGPERFIKTIPDVILLKINETEISRDYKKEKELPTFGSSLVNRRPVEVEISFTVERFINQELMIPFQLTNAPLDSANYVFDDTLVYLNFNIEEKLAGKFDLDSIQLEIDYRKMSKSDSLVLPEIKALPQLLRNKTIEVDSVEYYYQRQ